MFLLDTSIIGHAYNNVKTRRRIRPACARKLLNWNDYNLL